MQQIYRICGPFLLLAFGPIYCKKKKKKIKDPNATVQKIYFPYIANALFTDYFNGSRA